MRILLDQDGPLAGFDEHFWQEAIAAGHEFEIAGLHEQTARFITDHIHKDRRWEARQLTYQPGFFGQFPVVEGAFEGVEEMLRRGHDVWVCTKPMESNPTCHSDKYGWIEEHFPALKHKLIIAPDKSLIKGDILIDDAINMKWAMVAEWHPVVFSYPWNSDGTEWEPLDHWDWTHSVDELEYIVATIAERKRRGLHMNIAARYHQAKYDKSNMWGLI